MPTDWVISPYVLFAGVALGALGVLIAIPRRTPGPRELGGLVAGAGAGAVVLALSLAAGPAERPGFFFYVFGFLSLASALRVITHRRPVYAALFFVLTIFSSAGLLLLLGAEFLTMALLIIYAGAILITYLFVIMLATQAPEEGFEDVLEDCDAQGRDPVFAAAGGFILLGALTAMLFGGLGSLPAPRPEHPDAALAQMPRKVSRAYELAGFTGDAGLRPFKAILGKNTLWPFDRLDEASLYAPERGLAKLSPVDVAAFDLRYKHARALDLGAPPAADAAAVAPLPEDAFSMIQVAGMMPVGDAGEPVYMVHAQLPAGLGVTDIERVGAAMMDKHPLTLELAGVILLLAMVGAVVLARREAALVEDEKLAAAGGA